jgi:hypothetical protein
MKHSRVRRRPAFACAWPFSVVSQLLAASLVLLLLSISLSATVNYGEIINLSATLNPAIDPVTGVSVTFRWTTRHASNSIVILENPGNYSAGNNFPTRQAVNDTLTTHHEVVVDHLQATRGTWAYYVASQQANGTWATYPGPRTATCSSAHVPGCGGTYRTFTINAYNATGSLLFTLWPVGARSVYQGDATRNPSYNDLYVALNPALLRGPAGTLTMKNASVSNVTTGLTVATITRYICAG